MSELLFSPGASGYDTMFARITQLFVPTLIQVSGLLHHHRILDVATGTGAAAYAAAEIAETSGYVVGDDISTSMLHEAHRNAQGRVVSLVALDAQRLPFCEDAFDTILCQLGLMFFPDPMQALSEFHRVLRPSGRAAVSVTSAVPKRTLYNRVSLAIARYDHRKREAVQRLFMLGDPLRLGAAFERCGFVDIQIRNENRMIRFGSFGDFFGPVEMGSGMTGQAYIALALDEREAVREEVFKDVLGSRPDRPFAIDMEVLIGSGQKL
jgi:ubiquinone/menaquinone biosynthesis C-methylase UbiE